MLAVVLAAGSGERLHPLTLTRSKPMLPIAGRPMIDRVLFSLAAEGADRFILVAHPDDKPLIDLVSSAPWRGRVSLVFQAVRAGMADAVACAVPLIWRDGAERFLLASCDNLFPPGHASTLFETLVQGRYDAVLTLLRVQPEQIPTLGIVEMEGDRVIGLVEKPRPEEARSDLGAVALYALTPAVLSLLDHVGQSVRGELEFPDALAALIAAGNPVGGLLVERRMTLTRPADLLALNGHALRHDPAGAQEVVSPPAGTAILPPVRVEAGAQLGENCRLGPEVYLESGAIVGSGASLCGAVVLRGGRVPSGANLHSAIVHPAGIWSQGRWEF